jgi:hypothetical protein
VLDWLNDCCFLERVKRILPVSRLLVCGLLFVVHQKDIKTYIVCTLLSDSFGGDRLRLGGEGVGRGEHEGLLVPCAGVGKEENPNGSGEREGQFDVSDLRSTLS